MVSKAKLLELKQQLDNAGWEISNEEEMLSVSDDKIEWEIYNEKISSKENLVFFYFTIWEEEQKSYLTYFMLCV